ncbi:MAG TPA: zinc ribbon domain-containing protein [Anaerolineae bacterium]|nr:zinc ribbon domain-containing protein [Anaerolineae bacterium]
MPTYEFICKECGLRFTKSYHFGENLDKAICPNGHMNAQRIYSPPSIIFKGNGWYITDSKSHKKNTNS